jgi:hypothetical protein
VTTHLRGRAVQAGAFLAVVGGTIAVAASPAHAEPPGVSIDSVSSTDIASGDKTTIKFTITNPGDTPGFAAATVSGLDCSGDCSPRTRLNGGQSQDFTAVLTGGRVDPGEKKTVRIQVSARLNRETADATEEITVRGPDKPQQVRQVSGRVKDADGDVVSGAQILLKDSQGHQYDTTSDGDGGYQFTSSEDKPISPGSLFIAAGKNGYSTVTVNAKGTAGKTVNVSLTLPVKAASPSATPSPTETASEAPLDEATDPATAAVDTAVPTPQQAANADDGNGSLLFIILGGLLVAAGIGAIVLVLMRRKGGEDEDEDDIDGPGGVPPGSAGAGGFPDATRVAAPVGARASDATMITPMSGAPSMSDAPTMLQPPVPADDEFPDPYGAPAVPPTYGTPTQYGGGPAPAQGGGFHDGYPPQPQQPTQYGRPQGGYEQPQYDEPTGMYRPEPTGGFPPQQPGYGGYGQEPPPAGGRSEATGYQSGGYGSWDGQGGGDYGRGGQYGAAPAGDGGYGAAPAGGYGQPAGGYGAPAGGGYGDEGGYDPRAAYGRPAGYDQGGQQPYGGDYGDQGGYPEQPPQQGGGFYGGGGEQGGGRHGGGQQQPPGRPGQRRPVDWLDD